MKLSLDTVLLPIVAVGSLIIFKGFSEFLFTITLFVFFVLFALYIYFYHRPRYRYFFLITLIVIPITLYSSFFMFKRYESQPHLYVVDTAIQAEETVKMLLDGENFYTKDFLETPLAKYKEGKYFNTFDEKTYDSPQLFHYVYLPFYTLFSVPFFVLSHTLFNWYDQRMLHLILFFSSLALIYILPIRRQSKPLVMILIAYNPLFFMGLIQGFNDVVVVFWLILTLVLLSKRQYLLSSIGVALAVTTKQTAWFFVPFYLYYVYQKLADPKKSIIENFYVVWKHTFGLFLVSALIVLPFLFWDITAFWQDIYLYPSGKLATSFPVFGYGFSRLIGFLGFIHDPRAYYPFWIFQVLIGIPLMAWCFWQQKKNNSLSRMLFSYGVVLFVVLYFSRFFNLHYLGFITTIFVLSYFLQEDEGKDKNNIIS